MFLFILSMSLILGGIVGWFFIANDKERKNEIEWLEKRIAETTDDYSRERRSENLKELRKEDSERKKIAKLVFLGSLVLSCVCFLFSILVAVPAGYTGIKTTFGKVENETLSSGINVILPWQSVVTMDNRTQKVQLETQAFSSDIQQVDISLSVNYSIDQETAQTLYKTVGTNYYENVMYPRIQENTKAVFSKYTAESLVEKRNELSGLIADATALNMKQYGINIVSISIENIDFTDAFTDAVEAKQVAAQKKLTAETEQAQKTMEQEAEAKRAIIAENAKAEQAVIAAKADLEVVQIQAEASLYAGQREAEMNQRIAEALTGDLIQYYWIKQWNGKLPSTMLGNDPSIMLTLEGVDEE